MAYKTQNIATCLMSESLFWCIKHLLAAPLALVCVHISCVFPGFRPCRESEGVFSLPGKRHTAGNRTGYTRINH